MKPGRHSLSLKKLRVSDVSKEDPSLKQKIRYLEEQLHLLQKNNLNILAPFSEQPTKTISNQALIKKLKTEILSLEQNVHSLKTKLKKIEQQKEMLIIGHKNEISKLKEEVDELTK